MSKEILTQERLKELLHYNPETGIFTWIKKSSKYANIIQGRIAGCEDTHGYNQIRIDCNIYLAHKLVFLYTYGAFPLDQVDHINHIRTDNSLSNLRLCSLKDNAKNRSLNKNSKSGTSGVVWHSHTNKWQARISINGSYKHLGVFKEKNHAIIARWLAEDNNGYHANHGS